MNFTKKNNQTNCLPQFGCKLQKPTQNEKQPTLKAIKQKKKIVIKLRRTLTNLMGGVGNLNNHTILGRIAPAVGAGAAQNDVVRLRSNDHFCDGFTSQERRPDVAVGRRHAS